MKAGKDLENDEMTSSYKSMKKQFPLASILLFLLFNSLFSQQTIVQDGLITLERNRGFFGAAHSCPYYKLTIFPDGKIELLPKAYNKEYKLEAREIIKSQISKEQVKQLIAEFRKSDFYSFKSTFDKPDNNEKDCPELLPDSSSATISFANNGQLKTVAHYHGCRGTEELFKLTNLENKIDELVNIKQLFECYFKKST